MINIIQKNHGVIPVRASLKLLGQLKERNAPIATTNYLLRQTMTEITLTDNYEICLNGDVIGYFEIIGEQDNIIAYVEIDKQYRGNKYSKTATQLFLERAKSRGVNYIATSVLTSPEYETILREELDFNEIPTDEPGCYLRKEL